MSRIAVLMVSLAALAAVPATAGARPLTRSETKTLQRAVGVRADGVIGPRTRRAIRRFERRNGLRADGRIDRRLLGLLGMSHDEPVAPAATATGTSAAVDAARSVIGTPYAYGGTGPDGFDCSGLTMWAFGKAGVELPHSSFAQYKLGDAVAEDEIEAGDLVFFDTAGSGASDVGIATGPDTVISATSSRGVAEHPISTGYWGSHFVGARRLA